MVVPDLLDHLRASYEPDDDDIGFDQLFDQVRNTPLLILDDIDAASGTAVGPRKALPGRQPPLQRRAAHRLHHYAAVRSSSTTGLRPVSAIQRLSRVMVLDAEGAAGAIRRSAA
ncbi:MAG: hypothetical protein IPI85_14360 [Dehalococcoidia bacterium]|nr:hypothetical protein [Dehalococcoidia bacterium]